MIKILKYGDISSEDILLRREEKSEVAPTVAAIIAQVRSRGDEALAELTERFDGVRPDPIEVAPEEIEAAFNRVDAEFIGTLCRAAENVREFHSAQKRTGFCITRKNGAVLGQRVIPLDRAGVYVPGGTAAYPSTVLMDAIPAVIAGVGELIMATPPRRDGSVPDEILAAAKIAGVDRVFRVGGAQAIAAMAYGTESVPRVDKICGPGNAYVAEAKRQVFGAVSIDMIAGPSEIMVIADGNSDPGVIAADLLSQAEHDRMSTAVAVTDSEELAYAIAAEIDEQLAALPRRDIASASIETNGKIIVAPDLDTAAGIANAVAPEHLELCVDDPFALLGKIKHAGSVFLGRYCAESLGDYMAGPNHTLPTGGTARFSSPLSVDDFVKTMQFSYFTEEALDGIAPDVVGFARREGLEAHARSVLKRTEVKK